MSMRVYVAGAWVEQSQRARPMIAKLREVGITITHDWTVAEQRPKIACGTCEGAGTLALSRVPCGRCGGTGLVVPKDVDLTEVERLEHAIADLEGVRSANMLWLLAPDTDKAAGSWVELGAALMLRSQNKLATDGTAGQPYVIVSGAHNRRTIFTSLASALFPTDDEAYEFIVRMVGRWTS